MDEKLPEEELGEEEDDLALFLAFQKNADASAQEKLVARYSRLVVSLVRRFRGRAEWDDLLQVGYLGLMKAIQAYQPDSGNRFSTYATHCVTGELRHYLRDRTESVRRPRWLQGLSKKVGAFVEGFLQEHSRLPSVAEISEGCNVAPEGVVELLKAGATFSLEQLQGESGGEGLQFHRIRALREESFVLRLEDRIWLEGALERLFQVEREVLQMFFYRDLTQNQIAGKTGLSPKKVSRMMKKALSRLQAMMGLGEEE